MANNRQPVSPCWDAFNREHVAAARLVAGGLVTDCEMPGPKRLWRTFPDVIRGRHFATLCLLVGGVVLGGCAGTVSSHCDDRAECAQSEGEPAPAQSAQLLPPAGYVVKWSTCTHFVEGDAHLRNNSRVVRVRSDGTVPVQRAEPTSDPADNVRRVILAKLPQQLLGGQGLLRQMGSIGAVPSAPLTRTLSAGGAAEKISFVKLGQAVSTKEADGNIVQWVVSSEPLGEPVQNHNGKLEYQDTCFRNPNLAGKDTSGYLAPGADLAASCLAEELNQGFNAYSAYGYLPLVNYTTMLIPTANDPVTHPLPDTLATYLGFDGVNHNYTGMGAALNDINGAERDPYTNYYGWDIYCHLIISSGGFEVPGAKRPATRSLPMPGSVVSRTFNLWRPVNPNLLVANDNPPRQPDPIEPPPPAADVPVDAAEAIVPM
jgi:hypothetical protein